MKIIAMMPMLTHRIVRFASSPGDNGGSPLRFWSMMYAARFLTSWSVRLRLPPFGDDLDQERRAQRVGDARQFFDRVERGPDAPFQAGAVAARAVLGVKRLALAAITGKHCGAARLGSTAGWRGRALGHRRDGGEDQQSRNP